MKLYAFDIDLINLIEILYELNYYIILLQWLKK